MVLTKRRIPPVHEIHKPKTEGVPTDKVLTVTNQATLAAILSQISLVTSYANEMFNSLTKESNALFERIKQLTTRTQRLNNELPNFEKYFTNSNILQLLSTTQRSAFTSKLTEQSNLFDHSTMPEALKDTYNSYCRPPPKLHLLVSFLSFLLISLSETDSRTHTHTHTH
jgi:hypothetical protein